MNWLHPLIEEIHAAKSFSVEQRAHLVLCANELSAICDQVAPRAPIPAPVCIIGRLLLYWGGEGRGELMFGESGLTMHDKGETCRIEKPSHAELRRAVQSFFEAAT